ncbi:MAG: hypothetical protein ABEJ82_08190 [Haloplanus sp.]
MSASNPLSSAFELQRTMIAQSRRAAETSIDLQRTFAQTWFDSVESAQSVQQSGVTLSKRAVDAYLEGLKTVLPEESVAELEAAVDEQFEAFDEIHANTWESFLASLADAEESYEELTDVQLRMLADAFDAAERMQADAEETAEEVAASAEELTESA